MSVTIIDFINHKLEDFGKDTKFNLNIYSVNSWKKHQISKKSHANFVIKVSSKRDLNALSNSLSSIGQMGVQPAERAKTELINNPDGSKTFITDLILAPRQHHQEGNQHS